MNGTSAAVDMSRKSETTSSGKMYLSDSRFSCNICLEPVSEPVVTQCGHLYCWPCLYRWLEPGMTPSERQSLSGRFFLTGTLVDDSRRVCPVCKAACSVPTIVPIYVRTEPSTPREKERLREEHSLPEDREDGEMPDISPPNQTVASSTPIDDNSDSIGPPSTGLRLRFRSRDSEIPAPENHSDVPARPPAASPLRPTSQESSQTASLATPLSPPNRVSLGRGLALPFQQSFPDVPPLHHRETTVLPETGDPDATEFLSRILLMLGSFVILCLLLF